MAKRQPHEPPSWEDPTIRISIPENDLALQLEVGKLVQFRKRKAPVTYRHEASLSLALDQGFDDNKNYHTLKMTNFQRTFNRRQ